MALEYLGVSFCIHHDPAAFGLRAQCRADGSA